MKPEFIPPKEIVDEVWQAFLEEYPQEYSHLNQEGEGFINYMKQENSLQVIKAIKFTLAFLKETKPHDS